VRYSKVTHKTGKTYISQLELRYKYNEGWKANREVGEVPKKYIFEYFKDKGVEIRDIIIYNAYSIVPHKANFTKTASSALTP
jgi:hypothetical protein